MSKPLIGLLLGAALGLIDGLFAFRYPQAVTALVIQIVIGSTSKGLCAGVIAGLYARRVRSVPRGIAVGLLAGLVLSFLAAAVTPDLDGHRYYFEIMLPGAILGGIVGFATQRFGRLESAAAGGAT